MSRSEFDLKGKVTVVTGGAGLIGKEVCDAYASYGARVVITDIVGQEQLDAQAAALRSRYPDTEILPIRADLTSDESVAALFATTKARYETVDVLVNLAAIDAKFDAAASGNHPSLFENDPLELWQRSVAVNCTGLLRVTQAAIRFMLPRKSGNVINVASTYSLVAPNQSLYKFPGQESQTYKPVDYVGTKSMVPNFTRYLAAFYGRDGIRSNCIVPHGVFNNHGQQFQDNFNRMSPLGRMCNVSELRGPFVLLASDASSYMTGSTLVVDGGWTAW